MPTKENSTPFASVDLSLRLTPNHAAAAAAHCLAQMTEAEWKTLIQFALAAVLLEEQVQGRQYLLNPKAAELREAVQLTEAMVRR